MSGWAAHNDDCEKNKEVLARIIRVWATVNDYMVANPDKAIETLQQNYYKDVPLPDLKEQLGAQKMFKSAERAKMYADGTVTKWQQQVTDFFVDFAKIPNSIPASKYFRPRHLSKSSSDIGVRADQATRAAVCTTRSFRKGQAKVFSMPELLGIEVTEICKEFAITAPN
jgi:hypothetical protein